MLASLRIQNLVLVEELEWNLGAGFSAVTGETGAGKSIIIGALKLLLGERADRSLIRAGADTCAVEAQFQLGDTRELDAQLAEQGVEPCVDSSLIVKRTISRTGATRQFVNCCATTLAALKNIGDALVDLHGPHDHQSLLSSDYQLRLLDAFAGAEPNAKRCREQFRTLTQLNHELRDLSAASVQLELDLLKHQVTEIESAELSENEEQTLLARYSVAKNSRRLVEMSTQILQHLSEADDAVLTRLAEDQRLLRDIERLDPAAASFAQSHAGAITELEELARSLQRYLQQLELDPRQLAQLEERVTLLENLKRKYGGSISKVIATGQKAGERLRKLEHRGEEIARLERETEAARVDFSKTLTELTVRRENAASKLAGAIRDELQNLGFRQSQFEVKLTPLPEPGASGAEAVEFLFAPNPGEPLSPFRTTASSGEVSRVMLAVKSALAAQDRIPVLVFDEIDANVGGEIAHAVGAKMHLLGREHQVLCITHLPQVAAVADAQFVVTKEFARDRTTSRLAPVEGKARVEEIARMLGGKTASAFAHARELLR